MPISSKSTSSSAWSLSDLAMLSASRMLCVCSDFALQDLQELLNHFKQHGIVLRELAYLPPLDASNSQPYLRLQVDWPVEGTESHRWITSQLTERLSTFKITPVD